jgi:hypothetical protein
MGGAVKAVAGIAIAGVGIATGFAPLIGIGVSVALAGASQLLAPKIKPFGESSVSFGERTQKRTQMFQSTVAPRQLIYGEPMVSGLLLPPFSSGTNDEFIHLFVLIAGRKITSFGNIFLDGVISTDAKFSGLVTITTHTGSQHQAADSGAVADIPEWTTAHRLRGIPYIYAKLKWDRDVWINGIPQIKARVKGHAVLDSRSATTGAITAFANNNSSVSNTVKITDASHGRSTGDDIEITGTDNFNGVYDIAVIDGNNFYIHFVGTFPGTETGTWNLLEWSHNPILCERDFAVNEFGINHADVDDTTIQTEANVCEEPVSLLTSAAITAFEDAGGEQVKVTSVGHGRSEGSAVTIAGTTNYNGPEIISNVDKDNFEITHSWDGDDATGTWTIGITGAANGGGGKVIMTSEAHGFSDDESVTQAGTSDYNGTFTIDEVTPDTYEITDTWVSSQTGTITAATQERYVCDGVLTKDDNSLNMIVEIRSACAGTNVYQQGVYKFYAGAYHTPTTPVLTEHDLRGEIKIQTKDSRKDLFNAIKGEFVDANNNYLPTNFPPITNSTFEAEDGGTRLFKTIQLSFTINSLRAQRISKIQLMRSRQGVKVSFPAKMTAYNLAAWNTVEVTIGKLEWTLETFRLLSWMLSSDGGIDLELQEETAADWAWANNEGQIVTTPSVITLPDPITVGIVDIPSGLTATARRLEIQLTWTANNATDRYDIQRADDSGFTTNLITLSEKHGGTYYIDDIGDKAIQRYYRIRAVDLNGNVSAYTSGVNSTTAGIDTAEVVDDAITISGAASTDGTATFNTSFVTVETVTITVDGNKPVAVWGKLIGWGTNAGTASYRIIHAGSSTVIDSGSLLAIFIGPTPVPFNVALLGIYTPSTSGSHTFNLQASFSAGGTLGRASHRRVVAIELKK